MPRNANADLAWLIQPETEYSTRLLRAHVVIPQPNGELHSPRWGWSETGRDYADFVVSAYIGHSSSTFGRPDSDPGEIWGLSHSFRPHHIDNAEHAKSIASVFAKVARGLKKAEETGGYVRDGDFHAYLLRIAGAVGIRTYYVANLKRQRDMSGDRYRKVNAATLQWYVGDLSDVATNRPAELLLRD